MNRGSASSLVEVDFESMPFNEAPIHESGKCTGRTQPIRSYSRLQ